MTLRPATLALLAFFAVTLLAFGVLAPRFATASNAENLMGGFSFVAILAMGQAFPILTRGIDLSVGSIVALVGMVVFDLSLILQLPEVHRDDRPALARRLLVGARQVNDVA